MQKDKHETEVIFRRFKSRDGGQVIALFPALVGDISPFTCESYMHIGQHGAASVRLVGYTKLARIEEEDTKQLFKELERLGYNLRIVRRFTQKHLASRRKQLQR